LESDQSIATLRHIPGGAFGSCRYKMRDMADDDSEYQRLIQVFKAHNIGYFFYNGGGDSADTCLKVSQISQSMGYPI
jgi:6-phosphofructokinase